MTQMDSRITIVCRHLDRDSGVEQFAHEHAAELMYSHLRVQTCRVVVDVPHRPRGRDPQYQVRVAVGVVDRGVAIGEGAARGSDRAAIFTAIAEAFAAVQRSLDSGTDRPHPT